jgi:hypothetical protein
MRTLPVQIDRDGWTVDQCAALARDRGYPVFALQWYHNCFLGSVADVARMIAVSLNTTDAECSTVPCVANGPCVAGRNKVFFLEGRQLLNHLFQFPRSFPQITLVRNGIQALAVALETLTT